MKIRNPKSRFHLNISKSSKVLDVGGGHNPHPRANVVVGSLREEIGRGDLVILDQFIDFTKQRAMTFHEQFASHQPVHTPMADPFNPDLRATLKAIIAKLEDPVTELVRRDSNWKKLGLTDADAATPAQVVDLLVKHKELLQRPLVVTKSKAIIGRPKERVRELLS